jgi:branched-chain amino acid transport system substrate-binding protein
VKGKKVRCACYDDQSKPEEAPVRDAPHHARQGVAILGEVASSNSLAMAPKAQAAQMPMITPASTNPKVTEVGDYIFPRVLHRPVSGRGDGQVRATND